MSNLHLEISKPLLFWFNSHVLYCKPHEKKTKRWQIRVLHSGTKAYLHTIIVTIYLQYLRIVWFLTSQLFCLKRLKWIILIVHTLNKIGEQFIVQIPNMCFNYSRLKNELNILNEFSHHLGDIQRYRFFNVITT